MTFRRAAALARERGYELCGADDKVGYSLFKESVGRFGQQETTVSRFIAAFPNLKSLTGISLAMDYDQARQERRGRRQAANQTQEEAMGRVTKKEVAEAAQAVGLRLPARMGGTTRPWVLLEATTGKKVASDTSLASLLAYCRDLRQAQEAPETMPAQMAAEQADGNGADDPPVVGVPAVVVDAERTEGAALADRLSSDSQPYDLDRSVALVRGRLGSTVVPMIEAGAELIRIKEHEAHGTWVTVLKERIGISPGVAKCLMRAARKFIDGPNRRLVADLNSATKVYELALMDDEDLDELREGGTIAGATLDDIQRMSPSELRATLRAERKERREREKAQRERSAKKGRTIDDLEESLRETERRLDVYRFGEVPWAIREEALMETLAVIDHRAFGVCAQLRAAVERMEGLAAEAAGWEQKGQPSGVVPAAALARRFREKVTGIINHLGLEAEEIGRLISDPLPTEHARWEPVEGPAGPDEPTDGGGA